MSALVLEKLYHSIWNEDKLILIVACIAFGVALATIFGMGLLRKAKRKDWGIKPIKFFHWFTRIAYTLELSLISSFPLFGMLGTVNGLLGLDLATGDMENIKTNFFLALTSTAWGIIFSIGFKIFFGLFTDAIEEKIEWSKKELERASDLR